MIFDYGYLERIQLHIKTNNSEPLAQQAFYETQINKRKILL